MKWYLRRFLRCLPVKIEIKYSLGLHNDSINGQTYYLHLVMDKLKRELCTTHVVLKRTAHQV